VLIDPHVTTGPEEKGLPSVRATVVWSKRERSVWNVGVTFDDLPAEVQARLGKLVPAIVPTLGRGTGSNLAVDALPLSASGRERLYQIALEKLAAGDHREARAAAMSALRAAPHARHLRALIARCNAEEALAAGRAEVARRELAVAERLAPDPEHVLAMTRRLPPAPPPQVKSTRTVLARLFKAQS
jgi:hypothetical protein